MKALEYSLLSVMLIVVCTNILLSCKNIVEPVEPAIPEQSIIVDTIFFRDTIEILDTLKINELKSENKVLKDSIEKINSSIKIEDYTNARKIEKIKYYIKITEKSSSNKKYFFGWIKRTMSDD